MEFPMTADVSTAEDSRKREDFACEGRTNETRSRTENVPSRRPTCDTSENWPTTESFDRMEIFFDTYGAVGLRSC